MLSFDDLILNYRKLHLILNLINQHLSADRQVKN